MAPENESAKSARVQHIVEPEEHEIEEHKTAGYGKRFVGNDCPCPGKGLVGLADLETAGANGSGCHFVDTGESDC